MEGQLVSGVSDRQYNLLSACVLLSEEQRRAVGSAVSDFKRGLFPDKPGLRVVVDDERFACAGNLSFVAYLPGSDDRRVYYPSNGGVGAVVLPRPLSDDLSDSALEDIAEDVSVPAFMLRALRDYEAPRRYGYVPYENLVGMGEIVPRDRISVFGEGAMRGRPVATYVALGMHSLEVEPGHSSPAADVLGKRVWYAEKL